MVVVPFSGFVALPCGNQVYNILCSLSERLFEVRECKDLNRTCSLLQAML